MAQARLAGEVTYTGYALGSRIFTMGVAGDGKTVSTHPGTLWYNPRMVVNHDENNVPLSPEAFTVDVGWSNDGTPEVATLNSNFQCLPDVEGTVVWLDSSTLQMTVSGDDVDDVEVILLRTELVGRIGEQGGPRWRTSNERALVAGLGGKPRVLSRLIAHRLHRCGSRRSGAAGRCDGLAVDETGGIARWPSEFGQLAGSPAARQRKAAIWARVTTLLGE